MTHNFDYYNSYEDDDFSEEINCAGEAYQEYLENPNDLTAMEAALEMYGIPDSRLILDD